MRKLFLLFLAAVMFCVPCFAEDISGCRSFDELPEACRNYIQKLEQLCECPVAMVGVGPAREQNLYR